jgi:membrane associated rhomboid family serine protease
VRWLLAGILLLLGYCTLGIGSTAGWPEPLARLARVWLHQNWPHLVGNVLALLVLGTALERARGPGFLLLVWLISGFGGAALSELTNPTWLSLGSSGAVFGLIGALLVTIWRRPGLIPGNPLWLSLALLALTVSGFQATKLGWPVDRMSHLGGWLVGAAISGFAPGSGGISSEVAALAPDPAPEIVR